MFQLYDLAEVLPTLNYKIISEDIESEDIHTKNTSLIKRAMKKTKHKQLSRDILTQTITAGTLCGIWVGEQSFTISVCFQRP